MSETIKNSMLHTLFSWFAFMARNEIESNTSEIARCINAINKYYDKRHKNIVVSKSDEKLANEKLKQVQKYYEELITIKDENGNVIINENGDIKTIEYSTTVYTLMALDYMLNIERDTHTRVHLGHYNVRLYLSEIEVQYRDLFYDSIKIYNKLIDFIKEDGLKVA